MRELAVAAFLFLLLSATALAIRFASWTTLLVSGGLLIGGGLLFSLPCAVRYHVLLYRALRPRGALDRRWLFNPTGHHERLTEVERRGVMPWFYAGAAGWGVTMVGCVLAGIAAVMSR